MKKIIYIAWVFASGLIMTSCVNDLNTTPLDEKVLTVDQFYKTDSSYMQALAKCYAGLSLTGQQGPSGNSDITAPDEGQYQYIRAYWNLQELPTDEAIVGWNDPGLPDINTLNWASDNGFVYALYSRIYFQIAQCNEFLRQTTDAKLTERGITGTVRTKMPQYRAEVRFLRDLSYWHAIDLFGDIPFVTEDDAIGTVPTQKARKDVFDYLVKDLKDIETNNLLTNNAEYPRVGLEAVQTLIARLYLNAEVYTGTAHWEDCKTYCAKVIATKGGSPSGGLAIEYKYLFGGDNDKYARGGSEGEIIFTIAYDYDHTQGYGGTMYLTAGAYGGKMQQANYGATSSWGGIRTKPQLIDNFNAGDSRYLFYDSGNKENTNMSLFTDGFGCIKYTNLLSTDWANTAKRAKAFPDTDFPVFRLADVYLMYAEAAVRSNANKDIALQYINLIRERANLSDFSSSDLTLDNILKERGREFYWEGQRRTDLIRFGKFTGDSYLWSWKGGVIVGKAIDSKYRLYPIPAKDIAANPNLKQNPGYN
ncbi:MAG: RagB/SusD family nutrient uptake outer membrane protein [Bacteroidota bacterium]|nr:RagB/SusD family nutrient uptake outer membrane protein [Bacteroidota bacterium]